MNDEVLARRKKDDLVYTLSNLLTPEGHDFWSDDDGSVLWWLLPVEEPPYVGTPTDDGWPFYEEDEHRLYWTRIPTPMFREVDA